MSIKQFKFVSPGVFINEIDNSFLPDLPDKVGPVVIGRTERGPALVPYKVNSFAEFINVFGNPIPGGSGKDVWRYGNYTAPTYAAYAAQAYLRNSAPLTIVRLAGDENPGATTDEGEAGWRTTRAYTTGGAPQGGGAYGLWIAPSGSTDAANRAVTGTLAAIWYCDDGHISLSGALAGPGLPGAIVPPFGATSNMGTAIMSTCAPYGFKARINDGTGYVYDTEFDFNPNSSKFIRKVFNTNPTLTNNAIGPVASATASYWLGETYENWLGNVNAGHDVTASGTPYWGVILPLVNPTTTANDVSDQRVQLTTAQTDWIFSQDLSEGPPSTGTFSIDTKTQDLFKIHALNSGLWEPQHFKIAIQDIRYASSDEQPYGTFSIVVRDAKDSDSAIKYTERFSQCSLDPRSPNYIARKIGDAYREWNYEEGRYIEYGNYRNRSKYMRVEMNELVDGAFTDERYLPYGYRGPTKFADWFYFSGSATGSATTMAGPVTTTPVSGAGSVGGSHPDILITNIPFQTTASFVWPAILARTSSLTAPSPAKAYWGARTQVWNSATRFDYNWYDYVRAMNRGVVGGQHSPGTTPTNAALSRSFEFTLDDLSASVNYAGGPAVSASNQVNLMYWSQGSRAAGRSYRGSGSYKESIKRGFDQFIVPLYGGSDGVDIHEMDPFNNRAMTAANINETTSYEYNSIKRAIESVTDPEVVDCNIITMPGLTLPGLNQRLLRAAESRADSLAIIDLPGGYQPKTETIGTEQDRMGSLTQVIADLEDMQENTSYGCAYYPWIQIRDPQNNAMFWAPPSIAALGVMANTEKQAELWFAPAGFNRGGLSIGSAGLPVTNARQKLSSKERDLLYEANINPIASFPNEGLVVFGQKTLQMQASALDRINVRRLMNFIKKEVSRMAATILFDQNIPSTWNRFLSRVNPFLRSVKARFGLQEFKVVLDNTTTTPELIDRNIMYAKIFLKPTRSIEFIAIDFNISNSGAAFAD